MLTYLIGTYLTLRLYKGIRFYIIKMRAKAPSKLLKGAEPFLLKGGNTGVVLIHGFSGSPFQYKELANSLSKKGYTVYAPLLPGHGTVSEKLMLVKWQDYFEKVNQDVEFLSNVCDNVFVIGTSFGGNLALSAHKNSNVKGLIVVGTPMIVKRYKLYRILLTIVNEFKISIRSIVYVHKFDKYAKRVNLAEDRVGYHSLPLMSIYHFIKAQKYSKTLLDKIKKPILIINSKTDIGVPIESAKFIYDKVRSHKKKIMLVEDSYHNVFLDRGKHKVAKEIIKFIEENKK